MKQKSSSCRLTLQGATKFTVYWTSGSPFFDSIKFHSRSERRIVQLEQIFHSWLQCKLRNFFVQTHFFFYYLSFSLSLMAPNKRERRTPPWTHYSRSLFESVDKKVLSITRIFIQFRHMYSVHTLSVVHFWVGHCVVGRCLPNLV